MHSSKVGTRAWHRSGMTKGGGLKDSTHESKLTIIPLLMQSVALYIVAFVVLERLLCSRLFDNVTITGICKECELLIDFVL